MRVLLFALIFAAHWVAQFLAWSLAEKSAALRLVWNILAAPLIHVGGSLVESQFWMVASLNSALWAAVLTGLIWYFGKPSHHSP
jgi:hypothetical protein